MLTIRLQPRLSWLHAPRAEVPSRYSTAGVRKERTGACGSHLGRNIYRNCYVRPNLTTILLTRAIPWHALFFPPSPSVLTHVPCHRSRSFECHCSYTSSRVIRAVSTCARARCQAHARREKHTLCDASRYSLFWLSSWYYVSFLVDFFHCV